MLDFKGVMKGKVGDYKNGSHLRRGKYIYIYIYICKLILGTNGRLSTHEWVQIWYLFGILCT